MASNGTGSIYQILANAPYAVAYLNKQLHYVAASKKWISNLLLTEDLAGKSHLDLFPLMGESWKSIYEFALQGKGSSNDAELTRCLNGEIKWLKWEVQPVFDDFRQVEGIMLYYEVLSDLEGENTQLRKKLGLYEATNEDAKIGSWEFDFTQSELYWSPVTKQIHGVPPDHEPDLHSAFDYFKDGDSRFKIKQYFGMAFTAGTSYEEDLQIVTTHGEEIWVRVRGKAEFINGICKRIYGTFQNVQQQKLQELAIASSEIKYRSIIENSQYAFLLILPGKNIIEANQAAIDMFGYTLTELKAVERQDILDESDPRFTAFIAHRQEFGQASAEVMAIRKNGERFPCQLSSTLFKDANGRELHSMVAIDVTERRRAEEATKYASDLVNEEKNLLKTLIDNLPINIYIKDMHSRKVRVNRAEIEYMSGLTEQDILGKKDDELYPSEIAANSLKEDQEVLRTGVPMISKETSDRRPDGSLVYLLTSKIPLRNSRNEIFGLLGISYDITKIKEAESALAVNEEKYRKIFENIQDIYYRTDRKGIVTEISPSVDKYYNYLRDEIIGSSVLDFYFDEKERGRIFNALKRQGEVIDFELKLKSRRSQLVYASVNSRLIIENGIITGAEGSIRDISSRKEQENEMTELNTELKALNAHKEKLLSVIGHDLRSPVAASLKLAELALMDIDEVSKEELIEYLTKMEVGLQNANELLENLLQWAKNQFNSLNFNPVLIHDLKAVIMNCLKRIMPLAEAKGLLLEASVPEDLKLYADIDMLDAILRNLVSNAIKFSAHGEVKVVVTMRDYDILYSVKDTGIGIAEEKISTLFNPALSHTTYGTAGEKGTGLGLELCRDFVEKHQGKIWVESEIGKGTTFYFTTPI
jgi:PAS domain S-box-containing protein